MLTALPILPIATLSQYFFGPLLFILSLFMILLILVQRGKGGGLTGALGGPGGQSVFGSKAGDLFTRITVVVAGIWIFLLAFAVWWYNEDSMSSALAGTEDDIPTVTVDIGNAGITPAVPSVGEANIGDLGSGEMMGAVPDSDEAPAVPEATTNDAIEETPTTETPATAPPTETPSVDSVPGTEAPPVVETPVLEVPSEPAQ